MERTLVNKKRKADEGRTGEEELHSGREVLRGVVHKCAPVLVDKEGEYEELSEDKLDVCRGRYKNVDAMEGYMLNEMKEAPDQTLARCCSNSAYQHTVIAPSPSFTSPT
jgi:hypothetical protein